ncbi:membrane protein insertase YidC [Phnomibacter sp. MR]|uniref:membrane protein insertase YidC n=1 Tax=Phnomibacter sp. MR TaxID=3042318 RepID=UPI003A800683
MGFDRNTVIGFALLAVLFMGYFWYVSSNQQAVTELKKRQEDSIAALKPKVDTAQWKADSVRMAQMRDSVSAGAFAAAGSRDSLVVVENDVIKASFSSKGGWVRAVELKKFAGPNGKPVQMGGTADESFGYAINTLPGQSTESNKLYFGQVAVSNNADSSKTVAFTASSATNTSITHKFTIRPGDYRIKAEIVLNGANQLVSNQTLNLQWTTVAHRQQADAEYEKTQTRLVYQTEGEYDYTSAMQGASEALELPAQWFGLKQQFFNSTILSAQPLKAVKADVVVPVEGKDSNTVATMKMTAQASLAAGATATVPLELYYGPNDYQVLKAYDNGMHNIVDLGSGVFAFVKWINRWLILPVFDFLGSTMGGYGGWTILLLTIFIRLLIVPLTYSSYLSGAKMKALRPEIDAMKARLNGDQQAISMEQMKLFREAGVNPLGGCIPALFQIPIFFALYSFFNSNIDMRGIPFLWASDLSSYDSVLNMGFTIPFYGAHVSLFTITATITSLLISIYSMSTTPDTGNPMMKYMPYIFPFMMLFIFNKLPSALTWYYTVSNVITLILQFVIQNYVINHDKILAQIAANKAKPKKQSKWQERLASMQEAQQKMEEMKKKQGKK